MQSEAIELLFPHQAIVIEPFRGLLHRPGDEAAVPLAAVASTRDQAGTFEYPHMLAHCRKRHPERRGQFADRVLALLEPFQDPAPARIGERAEDDVEAMVNHMV